MALNIKKHLAGFFRDDDKKTSKKRKGRKNKDFPLISQIGFQEMAGDTLLEDLQRDVDADDTFVQLTPDGYLILALTENDLVKIKEDTLEDGSDEFGEFFRILRGNDVDTATLRKDLMRGIVGVIPTEQTFEILQEYDAFTPETEPAHQVSLHFALLPDELPDDDDDLGLTLLDSRLSPAEMQDVLERNKLIVYQNGDVRIVDRNRATGQADETPKPADDESSTQTNTDYQGNDNAASDSETDGSAPTQSMSDQGVMDYLHGDSNDNSHTAPAQQETPSEEVTSDSVGHRLGQFKKEFNGAQEDGQGANDPLVQSVVNGENADPLASVPEGDAAKKLVDTPEMRRRTKDNLSANEQTELRTSLSERQVALSTDADFSFDLDLSDIDMLLDADDSVPQLDLAESKGEDDALTNTMNAIRMNINSQMKKTHDQGKQQVKNNYINFMQQVMEQIQMVFAITEGADNKYANRMRELTQERDKALSEVDSKVQQREQEIRAQKNKEIDEEMTHRVETIRHDLLRANEQGIQNQLGNFRSILQGKINSSFSQGVQQVWLDRNEKAQVIIAQAKQIGREKALQQWHNQIMQEQSDLKGYENEVNQVARDEFDKEAQRQHDLADSRRYQQTITNLQHDLQSEKQASERKLGDMRALMDQQQSKHDQELADMKQATASQVAEITNQSKQREADLQAELAQTRQDVVNKSDAERERGQKKLDEQDAQWRTKMEAEQQTHDDEMKNMRLQTQRQLDAKEEEVRSAKRRNTGLMIALTLLGTVIGAAVAAGFMFLIMR